MKILEELEVGDRREGLFSCFGITPQGEVIYFDQTGSPCRAKIQGAALVRGPLVNLGKMPVEVISIQEAYHQLSQRAQQNYLLERQAKQLAKQVRLAGRGKDRRVVIAAAGLLVLVAFGMLVYLKGGDIPASLREAEDRLVQFYGNQGANIKSYKDVPVIPAPGAYNPLGQVSISREVFKAFLTENDSPAAAEADAMYQVCLEEGCDPAVALAFFEHESSLGKQGTAAYTKSLGNIRCTGGSECFTTEGNGSFRRYKSWVEGTRDWAQLLQFYKNDWKRLTLEEIIPRYAPQTDHNDETAYIAAVKKRVDNLRQRESALKTILPDEMPMGSPVFEKDWVITQGFNARHPAIDIARPLELSEGTAIHTTISGVVTVVRNDPLYGNRVFVSNSRFTAHYNHLTGNIPVQSGQVVRRNDVIGLMGNTGKSTGPHLDYELFQGQQRLNPQDWVYRGAGLN